MPTSHRGRVLAVAGLASFVVLFLVAVPGRRGFFDVGVYHGAVNLWLRDEGGLYDYLRPPTHYGFTYPPFAALVMSPMALLGWHPTIVASILLSLVAAGLLLRWLVGPMAERHGWERWYAVALAACLCALFGPLRDTFSYGQVNVLLMALVFADAQLLMTGRTRWAGIGIGLATAIKLTPAIFIVYLWLTGRWRAARLATGVALGATILAAAVAPVESRVFWTEAIWNTDRIGSLAYVSNQSLRGVLARLDPSAGHGVWALLVVAVLAVWVVRVRRAMAQGDELAGFALTAIAGCLISPVTWVHHLVWLIPAVIVTFDTGLRAAPGSPRRRRLVTASVALYVVLGSSMVWIWWNSHSWYGFVGGNAFVWASLALLAAMPIREPDPLAADLGPRERPRIVRPRSPARVDHEPSFVLDGVSGH
jgi:alpha-1,2-mannosyltransferase